RLPVLRRRSRRSSGPRLGWTPSRPPRPAGDPSATAIRAPLAMSGQPGTITQVSQPASPHLRTLVLLRRVRDRIDREYARPWDVVALARGVNLSAGHLSREFRRAYGESPYSYLMTRRIERAMALL